MASFFDESFFASTIFSVLGSDSEAIYIPRDPEDAPYTLSQHKFNEHHKTIEVDGDQEYETVAPTAWIRDSECPDDPHEDHIQIGDTLYTILGCSRDGHGFVELTLADSKNPPLNIGA